MSSVTAMLIRVGECERERGGKNRNGRRYAKSDTAVDYYMCVILIINTDNILLLESTFSVFVDLNHEIRTQVTCLSHF